MALCVTGRKQDPRVFMPLVGPEGEPIFAHWQAGLGGAAAFTSDATNRWAAQWLPWNGYADFWSRLVRTIARPARGRNLDLVTTRQGDQLHIRLDASGGDQNGSPTTFENFLDVRGTIITPNGDTEPITLQQTGPGVYEATAPANQTGNYIANLLVQHPDGSRQTAFGGMTRPPGEELRSFRSNTATLRRVAEITGGRWLDPNAANPPNLFDRSGVVESRSIRPLWRTLLVWLVIMFLLDVAARRIAWDPAALAAWVRERSGQIVRSLKPRRVETEPTLGALKNVRTVTAERLGQSAQPAQAAAASDTRSAPATTAPPPPPAPSRKRKFEADPAKVEPDGDLTQAIGGAQSDAGAKHDSTANPDADQPDENAGTTNRLRAAKQRARQNLQNDEQ